MNIIWAGENPQNVSAKDISKKGTGILELYKDQKEGLFSVPNFFIIPKQFFNQYISDKGLQDLLKINTFKEVNEWYAKAGGPYINTGAPRNISRLLDDFFEHFQDIFKPAIKELVNFNEYQPVAIKRDTEMQAAANAFKEKTGNFPFSIEDHEEAFKNVSQEPLPKLHESIIIRSLSMLEQGKYSFDGVFTSYNANSLDWGSVADRMEQTLSSSWSPYALFCMEQAKKFSHEMALMVQIHKFPSFSGKINLERDKINVYFNNGPTHDKFSYNISIVNGEFVKKVTDNDNVDFIEEKIRVAQEKVNRSPMHDDEKELRERGYWEEQKKLAVFQNDVVPKIINLQSHFPKNTSLEFLVDYKTKDFNVVQKRNRKKKSYHIIQEPTIPIDQVITRELGSVIVFNETGTAVNLMDYSGEKTLEQIDAENPHAIYILNEVSLGELLDEARKTRYISEDEAKEILMKTPNKKAIILPLSKVRWCHLFDISFDFKFPFVAYDTRDAGDILKDVTTGTKLGLWSDGEKTLLYKK